MTEHGMVYSTNELKKQLAELNKDYNGRKVWESLYGTVDLARQRQLSTLSKDYSEAITNAYSSAYANKGAIDSSNLGQGYKDALAVNTDAALEEAYETYRNNYLQSINDINQSAQQANAAIDEELTRQAEYTKQFANAPYEYLQYLFDKYGEGAETDNIFYNDELWKRYTYEEVDSETGEPTGTRLLRPWEDIVGYGRYDEITDENGNVVRKDWTGMYDEDGGLTIKGAEFYDQMINYFDSVEPGKGLGFGKWLSETNPELFDWSTTYNPYDYTEAGTNAGTFKTMVGLTSTDQKYSFIERFGGLTEKDVDTMYSDFTTAIDNIDMSSSGKDATKAFSDLTTDIKKLTDSLGITEDLEEELGGKSLDSLTEYMTQLYEQSDSNWDIFWKSLGVGAAAGAMSGASVGTQIPIGPIGQLIIGAVTAIATGTTAAIGTGNALREQTDSNAAAAKSQFTDLVAKLTEYSHKKRSEVQGNFYKQNK